MVVVEGHLLNCLTLQCCNAVVCRIIIRYDGRQIHAIQITYQIHAIRITYQYTSGQDYTLSYHGGNGGRRTVISIDVMDSERIVGIFGRTRAIVDMLGFITRVFGPYGGCGGTPFTVNSCILCGIHG